MRNMNAILVFLLLVAAVSTGFAQYDRNYESRTQGYGRQSEQNKQTNWMRACEGYSCPHPQVCRTTRGVPGCFDDPEGEVRDQHSRTDSESEITPERTHSLQSHNPHHPTPGYATTSQPRYHQGYGTPQVPLYPNLHPTLRPAYNNLGPTTPQPYHRGGYPAQQFPQGGYAPYQQYYPAYPYQQNYGNYNPYQQGGYTPNYGYRPSPAYPSRQPEYQNFPG